MSYRKEVIRTCKGTGDLNQDQLLNVGALGLAGEGGEVVDLIKKKIIHGKTISKDEFVKELGDVRWYFELLCIAVGTTIEEVEERNTVKLRARYPDGFSVEASIAKVDEKEGPA